MDGAKLLLEVTRGGERKMADGRALGGGSAGALGSSPSPSSPSDTSGGSDDAFPRPTERSSARGVLPWRPGDLVAGCGDLDGSDFSDADVGSNLRGPKVALDSVDKEPSGGNSAVECEVPSRSGGTRGGSSSKEGDERLVDGFHEFIARPAGRRATVTCAAAR